MTTSLTRYGVRSFDKVFIGGRWEEPSGSARIDVVSPITEEIIATVPDASERDMDRAVAAARQAFDTGPWPRLPLEDRLAALERLATEVEARLPEIVQTFTAEVGAPTAVSEPFNANTVLILRRTIELARNIEFEESRSWDGKSGTIRREPVGVVAAIIPWNGPVANSALKLAPALAVGCTIVLKPATEGPVSTLIFAEAIAAAGIPEGVVSLLPGGREVGEYLVSHPDVDKVTFTGSTTAGKRVMEVCSRRVANVSLELGGKSAGILADDIAIENVLPSLIGGSVGHSGQVCAAITRVLISRRRYAEAVGQIAAAFESLKVGDPFETDTVLGPVVAERQRDRIENYFAIGRGEGARVVTGGDRPAGLDKGWYVAPTLFDNVDNSMRIAREEIFGPVVVAIAYDSIDDAVAIANDSDFGLSGAVYTDDRELGESIARRIRTGQIFINSTDVCLAQPFGGFKQSGIGREGGPEGFAAFLETKLIAG